MYFKLMVNDGNNKGNTLIFECFTLFPYASTTYSKSLIKNHVL